LGQWCELTEQREILNSNFLYTGSILVIEMPRGHKKQQSSEKKVIFRLERRFFSLSIPLAQQSSFLMSNNKLLEGN